jgi:hypothetical protein
MNPLAQVHIQMMQVAGTSFNLAVGAALGSRQPPKTDRSVKVTAVAGSRGEVTRL